MPGPYASSGQSMTFTFRADVSGNRKGWKIRLSCPSCTERTLSFGSSPTSVSIGSSITCIATPSAGGGTVSYTASPAGIVNVTSDGVVTGVSVGTATITATIPASGSYCGATQTHTVTVVVPAPNLQQTNEPRCGIENVTLQASMPGGINVPTGYAYYWYSDAACTSEITSEVSGPNNNTLTIASVDEQQVWCRLEKRVSSTSAQTFNYSGSVATYTVPAGATSLILEVWGAEGGGQRTSGNTNSGYGGKGGYSTGTLSSPSGTLYVCVGGAGGSSTSGSAAGGYNGGGSGYASSSSEPGNGGGGATHIATVSGTLRYIATANVLIVAGGGGGGGEDGSDKGGDGGGTTGEDGQNTGSYQSSCAGGTQNGAGPNAGFGYGATTNYGDGGG
ncbi:MAG: hypothetical protein J5526_01755, partial [Bacteroidales bacterium]|nr:hypothetical protein [Bacteroidales bacterium]